MSREIVISDPNDLGETITVTVGSDLDFSTMTGHDVEVETQPLEDSEEVIVHMEEIHMEEIEGGGQGQGQQIQEEVVIKTELTLKDDGGDASEGKPVLPPIPFSFPGQTFDTKCQKLILNVWDFFKRVKKNPDILDEIRTPQERAAAALHISAATIGKIGKNLKRTGKLETPGKKRKRTRPIVDSVDGNDENVIRQIIAEYRNSKIVPTLPMVLTEARQRINFTGGATSFRRILQRMGFKNLSQKNVVKRDTGSYLQSTNSSGGITTLKVIKKEVIGEENNSNIGNSYIQISNSNKQQSNQILTFTPSNLSNSNTIKLQGQGGGNAGTIIGNASNASGNTLNFVTTSNSNQNLNAGNIIHISTSGGGGPIQLTQENAAALANVVQMNGGGGGGPQTFHILGADNTIRPIQIVYASSI